jgi:hypothetical protein
MRTLSSCLLQKMGQMSGGGEIMEMIISHWPQIVGERLAQQSAPVRLKHKTLFVLTWNGSLVLELYHQNIVTKIAELVGVADFKVKIEVSQSFSTTQV